MPRKPRFIDKPAMAITILVLVTLTAGLMLGATNEATEERIAELRKAEREAVMREALGGAEELTEESITDDEGTVAWVAGLKGGKLVGRNYEVKATGYGGDIKAIVAVGPDGEILKVMIVEQSETPGLGTKTTAEDFLAQFEGKKPADASAVEIAKLGGEIDAVTGATVSSRAVVAAVRDALAQEERRAEASGGERKGVDDE